MATQYVNSFTAKLTDASGKRLTTLLWGDEVHVLDDSRDPYKVKVRGQEGRLKKADLSDRRLLEIYVIDVGQGDGVLVGTPDGRWHLIDGGVANRLQMTKKGVANFLRWKFQDDLRRRKVSLANIILTHPDADHYGGLVDVMAGKLYDGRTFQVEVENFLHPGLARFKAAPKLGKSVAGTTGAFASPYGIKQTGDFITELLDGKNTFAKPPRALDASFAELAALVSKVPANVKRLSHQSNYLPGYGPGQNDVTIHVLGPILEQLDGGKVGLRKLGAESITCNGHSVVLRLDYGKARLLLTGDLNTRSHQLLLSYHPPNDFAVDVAKACHHGAEDVGLDFIKAMQARVTIASSGDNEDYSHPRPLLLGASAHYGREGRTSDGDLMPPLLYSTELARSTKLAYANSVRVQLKKTEGKSPAVVKANNTEIKAAGGGAPYRKLDRTPIATDLIYGLVNVRTDGEHILCATMKEQGNDFDVIVFKAGVDVP